MSRPSEIRRRYWHIEKFDVGYNQVERLVPVRFRVKANMVSSDIQGTEKLHAPVLDLDFPAFLIESSTAGHYHLYLDKPVTWYRYKRLLRAMYKAGLINKGWYKTSKRRKATFLRLPEVQKSSADTKHNKEEWERSRSNLLKAIRELKGF